MARDAAPRQQFSHRVATMADADFGRFSPRRRPRPRGRASWQEPRDFRDRQRYCRNTGRERPDMPCMPNGHRRAPIPQRQCRIGRTRAYGRRVPHASAAAFLISGGR